MKIRKFRLVDNIDRDAGGAGRGLKPGSLGGRLRLGDRQQGPVKILRLDTSCSDDEIGATAGERRKTWAEGLAKDFDARFRSLTELGLPEDSVGAACENHFFAI